MPYFLDKLWGSGFPKHCPIVIVRSMQYLSGPLNRLNAIPSLLQPLDRYRTPYAMGSAIGRPYLALSRIHTQVESSTASF